MWSQTYYPEQCARRWTRCKPYLRNCGIHYSAFSLIFSPRVFHSLQWGKILTPHILIFSEFGGENDLGLSNLNATLLGCNVPFLVSVFVVVTHTHHAVLPPPRLNRGIELLLTLLWQVKSGRRGLLSLSMGWPEIGLLETWPCAAVWQIFSWQHRTLIMHRIDLLWPNREMINL